MKKIYHVTLDKKLSTDDMQTIIDGIRLEEGVANVDKISYIEGKPKNEIGIEIHIGWNRVIRRIFQKLGYEVESLDRVMFAGLTKKNIKRGHWRILEELEVNNLKKL
jgi:23S rRNA pseudouridine2605 synthase